MVVPKTLPTILSQMIPVLYVLTIQKKTDMSRLDIIVRAFQEKISRQM